MLETMLGETIGIIILFIFIIANIFLFIMIFILGIKAIKHLIKGTKHE